MQELVDGLRVIWISCFMLGDGHFVALLFGRVYVDLKRVGCMHCIVMCLVVAVVLVGLRLNGTLIVSLLLVLFAVKCSKFDIVTL